MSNGTSIYRKHAGLVYAVAGPAHSSVEESVAPSATIDFTTHRKASPVTRLLPSTRKWLEALPRRIQPHSLCESYPRIANLIAAMWEDSEGLKAYFEDLLIDRRGNRRGFTPEVANDLRALRVYHAGL